MLAARVMPCSVRRMLQVKKVAKSHGARHLFAGVDWQLAPGDRVGFVGANGVGKTTFLDITAGLAPADEGEIMLGREETLGYLPQEKPRVEAKSALDRVLAARADAQEAEREIAQLTLALESTDDAEMLMDLAGRLGDAHERFNHLDGPALEGRARAILNGLGFDDEKLEAPLDSLSGGWWMRVELSRLLFVRPTYLLLDEPTNHLDLPSVRWLENFLRNYPGGWAVVSHDRYFLDRMVTSIAHLTAQGMQTNPGNYASFEIAQQERLRLEEAQQKTHERKVAHLESFIDRFGAKASKAKQAQSRVKQLEKLGDAPEVRGQAFKALTVKLTSARKAGAEVLTLRDISKSFGDHSVLENISLQLSRGTRLFLVGPNGAGKTTLLRIMAGALDATAGERVLGYQADLAYFAQHQLDALNPDATVLDEMRNAAPELNETELRKHLGSLLFNADAMGRRVAVLSGGEKSRLALAKLLVLRANVLLLDEPTNHLDVQSCEALIAALKTFSGTLVCVSHDRHFINQLASHVAHVQPKSEFWVQPGNYDAFVERESLIEKQKLSVTSSKKLNLEKDVSRASAQKDKNHGTKEEARRQKEETAVAQAIETSEQRVAAIDLLMCDLAVATDPTKSAALLKERNDLVVEQESLFARWGMTQQ